MGQKMTPRRMRVYKDLRRQGYSQQDIARHLGVSRSLLSYYENPTQAEREAIRQSASAEELREQFTKAVVTALVGDKPLTEDVGAVLGEKQYRQIDRFVVQVLGWRVTAVRLLALTPDDVREGGGDHE